mgnify:CR=1 FL=1|jgi:hypothetical protein
MDVDVAADVALLPLLKLVVNAEVLGLDDPAAEDELLPLVELDADVEEEPLVLLVDELDADTDDEPLAPLDGEELDADDEPLAPLDDEELDADADEVLLLLAPDFYNLLLTGFTLPLDSVPLLLCSDMHNFSCNSAV